MWFYHTGTCFIKKIYAPSSSLLQGKHLPFSPSLLRLNIFRLFVILSLTQLYRYTPRYFSFRLPHLNISTGSPSDKLDKNSDRMWLIKNFRKRRGHTFFEWNKCLWFIGWNLYLMWSPVNCRHNVRHIRTISFLLPPEWDGWSLNSHHIFINYIKFPLLRPN